MSHGVVCGQLTFYLSSWCRGGLRFFYGFLSTSRGPVARWKMLGLSCQFTPVNDYHRCDNMAVCCKWSHLILGPTVWERGDEGNWYPCVARSLLVHFLSNFWAGDLDERGARQKNNNRIATKNMQKTIGKVKMKMNGRHSGIKKNRHHFWFSCHICHFARSFATWHIAWLTPSNSHISSNLTSHRKKIRRWTNMINTWSGQANHAWPC